MSVAFNVKPAIGPNGVSLVVATLSPVQRALIEASPRPRGTFKQAWTMQLLGKGSKCRLPRGFVAGKKPAFVEGATHV